MTDETTEEPNIVWDGEAPDPVSVQLIAALIDQNHNTLYCLTQVVDMNERILRGLLIKDTTSEETFIPNLDQDE